MDENNTVSGAVLLFPNIDTVHSIAFEFYSGISSRVTIIKNPLVGLADAPPTF